MSWGRWSDHPLLQNAASSGYVAVSLFFILSGFILTYVHCAPSRPPIDRRDFFVNRFARIYPAYLFGLALIAPFYFVHTFRTEGFASVARGALAVLLLVQAYIPPLALVWNPPAWSLSDEAFFYALFPSIAPRIVSCRKAIAVAIGVACYAACLAAPLAYLALAPDGDVKASAESTGFWINALRYEPFLRLPEFVIGIVLGRLYLDEGVRRWLDEHATAAATAAVVTIAVVLAVSSAVPYPLLHNGVLTPAFVLLIAALASGRGPLASFLGSKPMVALGEASYSLYVIHVPLMIYWLKAVKHTVGASVSAGVTRIVLECAFLGIAVGASLLSHKYVEMPFRDRVRVALGRTPRTMQRA